MFQKKDYILLGIIGLVLGFFIAQQFYLHERITKTVVTDNENNLALEVSELIKTNKELEKERDELSVQHQKLSQSALDAETAKTTLEENLMKYEIILGVEKISGEGVEITFDSKLHSTQIVDLINAIKNIGAEAIELNGNRITINYYIVPGFWEPQTKVKVIGDKNLLYESLKRTGGILDQIGFGNVEKKDSLVIVKK